MTVLMLHFTGDVEGAGVAVYPDRVTAKAEWSRTRDPSRYGFIVEDEKSLLSSAFTVPEDEAEPHSRLTGAALMKIYDAFADVPIGGRFTNREAAAKRVARMLLAKFAEVSVEELVDITEAKRVGQYVGEQFATIAQIASGEIVGPDEPVECNDVLAPGEVLRVSNPNDEGVVEVLADTSDEPAYPIVSAESEAINCTPVVVTAKPLKAVRDGTQLASIVKALNTGTTIAVLAETLGFTAKSGAKKAATDLLWYLRYALKRDRGIDYRIDGDVYRLSLPAGKTLDDAIKGSSK